MLNSVQENLSFTKLATSSQAWQLINAMSRTMLSSKNQVAVGLMMNPGALRCWTVAGPEVVRMVNEFEALQSHDQTTEHRHHEQHLGVQTSLLKEVKSLVAVIEEMGNPFLEQSQDLLVLDTRDIVDQSVGESVRKTEELGEKQYHNFVDERLVKREVPITDVIHKNKLVLLSHPPPKPPSKQKMQVTALKNDCNLFSRLYISCQQDRVTWRLFSCMRTTITAIGRKTSPW